MTTHGVGQSRAEGALSRVALNMSQGAVAGETEREQEKRVLREGRKAASLRRGDNGYWRGCGEQRQVLEGLRRQVCVGAFNKLSDADGYLTV